MLDVEGLSDVDVVVLSPEAQDLGGYEEVSLLDLLERLVLLVLRVLLLLDLLLNALLGLLLLALAVALLNALQLLELLRLQPLPLLGLEVLEEIEAVGDVDEVELELLAESEDHVGVRLAPGHRADVLGLHCLGVLLLRVPDDHQSLVELGEGELVVLLGILDPVVQLQAVVSSWVFEVVVDPGARPLVLVLYDGQDLLQLLLELLLLVDDARDDGLVVVLLLALFFSHNGLSLLLLELLLSQLRNFLIGHEGEDLATDVALLDELVLVLEHLL
mmetsp:Transcript_18675/g.31938  ORF Transcript_18675/g.31938 Transcript_18675/m.31938 type:complete len:274 (-) Transcript_18675:86-907(-)